MYMGLAITRHCDRGFSCDTFLIALQGSEDRVVHDMSSELT